MFLSVLVLLSYLKRLLRLTNNLCLVRSCPKFFQIIGICNSPQNWCCIYLSIYQICFLSCRRRHIIFYKNCHR
ncbi:MAG: hypothetical protein KBS86_00350 [Proteobacteria bacterium]|nr:hypothetical protein [Candidatus Enterousia scatequi]